jgi:hypothetical protein
MEMTNKMPPVLRDHALQIAHHEMAHYVIARALGFETGGIKAGRPLAWCGQFRRWKI